MAKGLLVIDDSTTIREAARLALTGSDWELATAGSGVEAAQALQTHRVDAILCDVAPGEEDGYELCRTLGASEAGSGVPILLMGNSVNATAALAVGAAGTLPKPFSSEQLLQALEEAAEQSSFAFDFEDAPAPAVDDTPLELEPMAEGFELQPEPVSLAGADAEVEEIEVIDLGDDDEFGDLELLDDLEPVELAPVTEEQAGMPEPLDLDAMLGSGGKAADQEAAAGPIPLADASAEGFEGGAGTTAVEEPEPLELDTVASEGDDLAEEPQGPIPFAADPGAGFGGDDGVAAGEPLELDAALTGAGEPVIQADAAAEAFGPDAGGEEFPGAAEGVPMELSAEAPPEAEDEAGPAWTVDGLALGGDAAGPAAAGEPAPEDAEIEIPLEQVVAEAAAGDEPPTPQGAPDLPADGPAGDADTAAAPDDAAAFAPEVDLDERPEAAPEPEPAPWSAEPTEAPAAAEAAPWGEEAAAEPQAEPAPAADLASLAAGMEPAAADDTGDLAQRLAAGAGQAVREALEQSLSAERLAPLVEAAVERVAWEVVPQLAERLIRETIEKLQQEPPDA